MKIHAGREILPNGWLTAVQTDRFRTGYLSVRLVTGLCRKDAAKNALIPRVLLRGTARRPDRLALSAELDTLYGAEITSCAMKRGELQIVGLDATFADEPCVPRTERVLERVCALMGELLLSPVTRGGMFLPDYVEDESGKLRDELESERNDRRRWPYLRLTELMFPRERFAVGRLGDAQSAERIGYQGLTKQYRRLLAGGRLECFYCGCADAERVDSALAEALAALPREGDGVLPATRVLLQPREAEVRVFRERMDVRQTKLAMGFRLGACMELPDYPALEVFNALFGGGPASKLFQNVREKRSLCYDVSSLLEEYKGALFVLSGVEPGREEEAAEEIRRQLAAIARGEITREELDAAKGKVTTALLGAPDDPVRLRGYSLDAALRGPACTPEEFAGLCDCVTAERLAEIAAGVREDADFLLQGEGAGT